MINSSMARGNIPISVVIPFIVYFSSLIFSSMIFYVDYISILSKNFIPYFFIHTNSSFYDNSISNYYFVSFIVILIYNIFIIISYGIISLRYYLIIISIMLYWALGFDGRTIRLGDLQNGIFTAAHGYAIFLPVINALILNVGYSLKTKNSSSGDKNA